MSNDVTRDLCDLADRIRAGLAIEPTALPAPITAHDLRTVRSVLSVPAHDQHKITRARERGADLLMWDLEDSVPASAKARALHEVVPFLRSTDLVRINHPLSGLFDREVQVLRRTPVRMVMVPKVESAQDLWAVNTAFGRPLSIIACIESPAAIWRLDEILRQSPLQAIVGLAFGGADFAAAATAGATDLFNHAARQICMAALTYNLHASDGPCYDLGAAGNKTLALKVARSRRAGFASKGAIHPDQIAAINAGMRPSAKEMRNAQEIANAPDRDDPGARRLGSRVVAPPTVLAAKRELERSHGTRGTHGTHVARGDTLCWSTR